MADNIDEEHLDNSTNTQSENSADEIIPSKGTETIKPKEESENMEVHHHPNLHHKPKKWKEYFLEFLMIFLAVTMGFFAESYREHYMEHKRVSQFANLLVADLKRDTSWFNNENKRWLTLQPNFDTLSILLTGPIFSSNASVLRPLLNTNYISDARLNSATYHQMKTSGSLRYIDNIKLTVELEDYYEVQLPRALEISQSTKTFFDSYIKSFFIDNLRNQDMKPDADTAKNWNPVIFRRTKQSDQRLANIIDMARTQLKIANHYYELATKKASELIVLITKEYHLQND